MRSGSSPSHVDGYAMSSRSVGYVVPVLGVVFVYVDVDPSIDPDALELDLAETSLGAPRHVVRAPDSSARSGAPERRRCVLVFLASGIPTPKGRATLRDPAGASLAVPLLRIRPKNRRRLLDGLRYPFRFDRAATTDPAPAHPREIATLPEAVVVDEPFTVPADEAATWSTGHIAGRIPHPGLTGSSGMYFGATRVFRASDVYYAPGFGAVMDRRGGLYELTVAEAKFLTPDYAKIPTPARFDGPSYDAGGVFLAWGGLTNYGHFLLDCLSGTMALEAAGIRDPLIAPPLGGWHRGLLALLDKSVIETDAPLVHLGSASWSSCMDHHLHAPNRSLLRLRDRILSNVGPATGPTHVYVSRSRISDKRRMVNEIEVEQRLATIGFEIVHPQDMTIEAQVALFRGADVVVSATGAQLANALFMQPGSVAVEICPTNYAGIWIRNLCHLAGVRWRCHYFESPILELPHDDYFFSYSVDVERLVDFLDERS